jgi:hypothetical protein
MINALQVYQFHNKIRYGVPYDGGYVLGKLDGVYDCYLSCGVSYEESFSRDFIQGEGMTKENSYAFDGTIHDYPYHYTDKITFVNKNIDNINDEHHTDMTYITEHYNNIFMKMDIEGGEYSWILGTKNFHHFKQMIIEFHAISGNLNLFASNIDISDKIKCLDILSKTHYLIHAHGNNHSDVHDGIPSVIELTYVRKDCFLTEPPLNTTPLPIPFLDFSNQPGHHDITLNYPPFVTSMK